MASLASFNFTPILGSGDESGATCSLLQVDDCNILLDAGCDDRFDEAQLQYIVDALNEKALQIQGGQKSKRRKGTGLAATRKTRKVDSPLVPKQEGSEDGEAENTQDAQLKEEDEEEDGVAEFESESEDDEDEADDGLKVRLRIDAIVISHCDLQHLGALPFLVGRADLKCPIYATQPVYSMGQMFLTEAYLSRHGQEEFGVFDLSDVDAAFNLFTQVKYSQKVSLVGSIGELGVEITPYPAAHLLGGSLWRISKDVDDIIYAVNFNHRKERTLTGTVLESQTRPSLLIVDADGVATKSGAIPRRQRDQSFVERIIKTSNAGGNVLIPTDSAGRILELSYLIESIWKSKGINQIPVAILSHTAPQVFQFAMSYLEYMSEAINEQFRSQRENPFEYKYIYQCKSMEDLARLPKPIVVFAAGESLEAGFARQLFAEWCRDPKNCIIFTTQPSPQTLGGKLVAELNLGNKLSSKFGDRNPLEFSLSSRHFLVGNELTEYEEEQQRLEKKRRRMSELKSQGLDQDKDAGEKQGDAVDSAQDARQKQAAKRRQQHEEYMREYGLLDTSSKAKDAKDKDKDRRKSLRRSRASMATAADALLGEKAAKAGKETLALEGLDDEDEDDKLAAEQLIAVEGEQVFDVKDGFDIFVAPPLPIMMDLAEREELENSGLSTAEIAKVKKQQQLHSHGEIDVVPTASKRKQQFFKDDRNFVTFPIVENKSKFDEYGEVTDLSRFKVNIGLDDAGPNARSAGLGGVSSGIGDDKALEKAEKEDLLMTAASTKTPVERYRVMLAAEGPSRVISYKASLAIKCHADYIDFSGLSDAKSVKTILSHVAPKRMIVAHGPGGARAELRDFCLAQGMECYIPMNRQVVHVASDVNVYQMRLADSLVSSLHFANASQYELAWVEGTLNTDTEDGIPLLEKVKEEGAGSTSLQGKHKGLYIGELMLSEFKTILTKAGFQCRFIGGQLVCNKTIALTKNEKGKILIQGPISPEYFQIRKLLYSQYAII
eukprot:Clim_evm39s251 gene=Clim_evmTU39s251